MIFVGIDWAEEHHDVCALDERAEALDGFRIPEGIEGVGELHARLADLVDEPEEVVIGIETDRGLLVAALVVAGYQVYAINPLSVSRYRERHSISGAKSDPGDAKVLADLVRTVKSMRERATRYRYPEGLDIPRTRSQCSHAYPRAA